MLGYSLKAVLLGICLLHTGTCDCQSYVTQCRYFQFVFVPVEGNCFVNISIFKFSMRSFLFLFVSEIVVVKDVATVHILPTFYIKACLILCSFFFARFCFNEIQKLCHFLNLRDDFRFNAICHP